jgi:SAM-dependent methyltransferase
MRFRQQPPLHKLIPALRSWFQTELGQELLAAERAQIERLLPTLFGYHLLQLGIDSQICLYDSSPVSHKFIVAPALELGLGQNSVIAANEELPLERNSLDVVVLHHALDFAQSPHQVLREAARVLRPGGHLLVLGFNPLSLWGLYSRLCRRRSEVPWCGHFISHWRLSDWLTLVELVEVKLITDFFLPPMAAGKWRQRFSALERYAKPGRSNHGAFSLMVARKDVVGMTPIQPEWRRRKLISLPIPEPSARGKHCRENREFR